MRTTGLMLVVVTLAMTSCACSEADGPRGDGVVLQVLGSGGPIADDGRASSAYII